MAIFAYEQKLEMKNRDLLVLLLISLFILMVAAVIYIQQLLLKNKKAKKMSEPVFLYREKIRKRKEKKVTYV